MDCDPQELPPPLGDSNDDEEEAEWAEAEYERKRRKESKKDDSDCHTVLLGRFLSGSVKKCNCSTSQNIASDKVEASHIQCTAKEAGEERIVRR